MCICIVTKIFTLILLLPTLDDLMLFGLYIASHREILKNMTYLRPHLKLENTLVNFRFLSLGHCCQGSSLTTG